MNLSQFLRSPAADRQRMVHELINQRLMERLLSTPWGRAHVLSLLADAEDSDEGAIFELLETRVGDEQLQKLVRIHKQDEKRHAQMFTACVARQGVDPGPVPEHLKLIRRIDAVLGGIFEGGVETDLDVMQAYLVLQVIEERAITQFTFMAPIMRRFDPASADVMDEVASDEVRHLKYCQAIARRYAPSENEREETLRRYRQVEARCFSDNGRANLQHILANELAPQRPLEYFLWRALVRLPVRRPEATTSHFATDESTSRADQTLATAA